MQLRLKNIYTYMQKKKEKATAFKKKIKIKEKKKKEKSTERGIYHAPETRQVKTAFDLVQAYYWMILKK